MTWGSQNVMPGRLLPLPGSNISRASGRWWWPGGPSTSTGQTGVESLRSYPLYVPYGASLDRLTAEVTTIGDVGSVVRLGLYRDSGTFRPGALLLDAGTIPGDSLGSSTITVSLELPPGIYWTAIVSQVITVTQPTLRTVTPVIPVDPVSAPGAATAAHGYTNGDLVPGALPASFSVGGTVGSVARMGFRNA